VPSSLDSGKGLGIRDSGQLLHRNVQRFRGGLVFKAHRLCVSLNSGLESNKEEEEGSGQTSDRQREFNLPWHEAGPPNHHDDKVDSDQ